MSFSLKCVNPLGRNKHSNELTNFPKSLAQSFPSIPDGAKVCLTCKFLIYNKRKSSESSSIPKRIKSDCDDDDHEATMAIFEKLRSKLSETKSKDERMFYFPLPLDFGLVKI